ncbi:MAG TPA: choice-of-anchor B family protein [Bacteroidia bacterium]|nr:choice-of-anchor B family protein [Bacteroidia bacterium]
MKKNTNLLIAAFLIAVSNLLHAQANLNVQFRAQLTYPGQTCANICGYTDSLGNEYALVGASQGMSIVDVTNPSSPNEITQIPNIDDLWKEIKVYRGFAYVTTEGGGGLQIVDLHPLPSATLPYQSYTGDSAIFNQLNSIHALHIDTTTGYCYLFGTNLFSGGAVVLDLNADPYNPTYAGKYDQLGYVHDGYVDNDTLFAGHIYDGYFAEVDMTNKANPVVLGIQTTPTAFTHNTWRSDDHKYVFTTDENTNSYLAAFDVTDPQNYVEMDRTQSYLPGSGSIVHNTHILQNWAVTAWYKDGFVITDVTRPQNLVHVGYYDTYNGGGSGFTGAWGVYPYFPSGTIVVSNVNEGLFVFTPTYVRACYLEGNVTDSICGTPILGVVVKISTVNDSSYTDISGDYAFGTATPGTYDVTFSKPGYQTKTYANIIFAPGAVNTLNNVQLFSPLAVPVTGQVTNSTSGNPMTGIPVMFDNPNYTLNFLTDGTGNFSSCNVISGTYTVAAAEWGFQTYCNAVNVSSINQNIPVTLSPGYEDDFTFDLGWITSGTASAGVWERGEPQGTTFSSTPANPDFDVTGDCMDQCYVTGNSGGSSSQDDVDNGYTMLSSPVFDLSTYNDPWIHYDRWFFNDGGSGNPNDSMVIRLTDGATTVTLESITPLSNGNSSWVHNAVRVASYFPSLPATMRMIIIVYDLMPGHLVEGGFDAFLVVDSNAISVPAHSNTAILQAYPNPFSGTTQINYTLPASPENDAYFEVRDITGRLVSTHPVNNQQGNITIGEGMPGGIYFVRLMIGGIMTETIRVVKSE